MSQRRIQVVFENMGRTYQRMLKRFRPCKPGSEFLEQNLVTIFAHEFLIEFGDDACCYSEVPFAQGLQNSKSAAWKEHLDGFLIQGNNGYLLEAKGALSTNELFKAISDDIERIYSHGLWESLEIMARGQSLPSNIYGVIIADCWQSEGMDEKKSSHGRWLSTNIVDDFPQFAKLTRSAIPLSKYDGFQHYLLIGFSEQLNIKANKEVYVSSIRS